MKKNVSKENMEFFLSHSCSFLIRGHAIMELSVLVGRSVSWSVGLSQNCFLRFAPAYPTANGGGGEYL